MGDVVLFYARLQSRQPSLDVV